MMASKRIAVQNIQYFFACLFFASLNFDVFSPFIENLSVAKMVAFAYMGVSLLSPFEQLFNYKHIKEELVPIILMLVVMTVSSVIHSNDLFFDITIFLNFIMMWLLVNHTRRDERVFKEGLLWFSISSGIVGILFMMGIGVGLENEYRLTMFGDNQNETGIRMASSILFLLNYCLNHDEEKKIYKPWLLALIYPMLMLMFAGASRTALIVLALGLFVFILLYPTQKWISKVVILLIGVLVIVGGWRIVQQQEVLIERMAATAEDGNLSGRDYIWEIYWQLIEEHPILGLGFTGWHDYSIERFGRFRSPHNVIIEVLLISGVIGLFFYLWFLFAVFRRANLYYRRKHNMAPLLMSITILALVLSGQALGTKLFWTIAAYGISYNVTRKTKSRESVCIESVKNASVNNSYYHG